MACPEKHRRLTTSFDSTWDLESYFVSIDKYSVSIQDTVCMNTCKNWTDVDCDGLWEYRLNNRGLSSPNLNLSPIEKADSTVPLAN